MLAGLGTTTAAFVYLPQTVLSDTDTQRTKRCSSRWTFGNTLSEQRTVVIKRKKGRNLEKKETAARLEETWAIFGGQKHA